MRYTLIVHSVPDSGTGARSAIRFASALLRAGHTLQQVFFYHDGVRNALASVAMPEDEPDLRPEWAALANQSGCELAVCIAAATRRGIIDADEAERLERIRTLADPFQLAGLGQLIDAVTGSDRCITFVN